MPKENLISRIINLRESKDWSQTELGRRLGVDKSVMNKIESGTRKVSTEELTKLADIFDVSTDYLLGKESNPEKKDSTLLVATHVDDDLTDKQKQEVQDFIKFIKMRDHGGE